MKKNDNFYKKFQSSIPPHLTPEEKEEWEKELRWEREELDRRKREGLYEYKELRKKKGKLTEKIANLFKGK